MSGSLFFFINTQDDISLFINFNFFLWEWLCRVFFFYSSLPHPKEKKSPRLYFFFGIKYLKKK